MLEQIIYLETSKGLTYWSVTFLADSVANKWTVKFTVEGEHEDFPRLDFEIETNNFNHMGNLL